MDGGNRIAFITGSRADYGIMRRYLFLLQKDNNVDLSIIATGALLDKTYGYEVKMIYADGFRIAAEIEVTLDSSSNAMILHTMAEALDKFGMFFEHNFFDLVMILGDRYEMLSAAIAASMQKLPILHIHGGEATYGNYDEFIRHCITKMSLYHFTATEAYRNRVIQLGEHPDNVFYLGALGAENCLFMDEANISQDIKNFRKKGYFVVLYHPETLTNVNISEQMKELFLAIDCFPEQEFVFLGTNADTYSYIIRQSVSEYVACHANACYFENLHTDAYHYLLKNAICLIGNSSSGIIEAPSLGIFTINIGERQKGRIKGNSVLNVACHKEAVLEAMDYVMKHFDDIKPINPYYQENTAERYYEVTKELLNRINYGDTDEPKKFYDIRI